MGRKTTISIGQIFGRLTVIGEVKNHKPGKLKFKCRCECGVEKEIYACHLNRGTTVSCGCYKNENIRKRSLKHGYTCNDSSTRNIYLMWNGMLSRCFSVKNKNYKNYGARGITVCEEWKDIHKFVEWVLNNGYNEGLTLDRIDNNGNYQPDNCKFSSYNEQNSNKRNNRKGIGIRLDKSRGTYIARLVVKGKRVLEKRCKTYEEALQVRKDAEIKHNIYINDN